MKCQCHLIAPWASCLMSPNVLEGMPALKSLNEGWTVADMA